MLSIVQSIPGLVWAYTFDNEKRICQRLPPDATRADLSFVGSGFRWLHLNLADQRVAAFLEEFPELPTRW